MGTYSSICNNFNIKPEAEALKLQLLFIFWNSRELVLLVEPSSPQKPAVCRFSVPPVNKHHCDVRLYFIIHILTRAPTPSSEISKPFLFSPFISVSVLLPFSLDEFGPSSLSGIAEALVGFNPSTLSIFTRQRFCSRPMGSKLSPACSPRLLNISNTYGQKSSGKKRTM